MFKRFICLITVIILVVGITGCNRDKKAGNNEETGALMRYAEEGIAISPDLIKPECMQINSKGQLVVYNAGAETPEYLILGADGKVQDRITFDFEGLGNIFALDAQDNLYIVNTLMKEGALEQKIHIADTGGNVTKTIQLDPLKLSEEDSYAKQISGITVDREGNILLTRLHESVIMIDEEGNEKRSFGDKIYKGAAQVDQENNLITCGVNTSDYENALEKYNLSTGKSVWRKNIEQASDGFSFEEVLPKVRCDSQDGSIYVLTDSGIEKFDSDGNHTAKILDFKEHTILSSGLLPTDMCMDSKKTLYLTAMLSGIGGILLEETDPGASSFELFKYVLREVEEEDMEQITLSVPSSNRLIEMAVSKFNKENPGTRILVKESGTSKAKKKDYERYVNTLNTELMSGRGPDIISVAELPYEKYIDKNILADLTKMMAEDSGFQQERFFTNILEAMKYDGKLYNMPVSIALNALVSNQKALSDSNITFDPASWTWDDFNQIADSMDSTDNVYIIPPNVGYVLLQGSYGKFIDMKQKKASFDSEEFIKILEMTKKLGIDPENYSPDGLDALFDTASRGTVLFSPQSIETYIMLSATKVLYGSDLDILHMPGSDAGPREGSFSCNESFAVNSNSPHKEKAWEFIKILLSDEIQTMDELAGFAVSKAALREKADKNNKLLTTEGIGVLVSAGNAEPVTPEALTQEEIALVERYIQNLSVYSHVDSKILEMIQTDAEAFFSGKKSAEEAAKAIQNRVNIYMGE